MAKVLQVSEHLTPDETLTKEGYAADSKAVGDELEKKSDKDNPEFTGTMSMGRWGNNNVGEKSVGLGHLVVASGKYSHAEGHGTTASGESSHAEGRETTAYGKYSHAEGETNTASGDHSHAEGRATKASGTYSHTEGSQTKASGTNSHAEGFYTTASGHCSHAEGFYTKASGENQHVQGRWNIEDTENKYAHIVGNGTVNSRSNAHTVDWDGNGWYAGKLTQEGIPTEEKDLTTKKYVDGQKPFVAEYNSTAFTDIKEAYNAKKMILCTDGWLVTKLDIFAPDNYAQFSGLDDMGNPALLKVTKDNVWSRTNVSKATTDYVIGEINNLNKTKIAGLENSVGNIGTYINGKDPLLSALSNMNTVDILKSVYSFRGGFCNNAGTLHIKNPGIYLIIAGGTGNKTITINYPTGKEFEATKLSGIILLAYESGVVTPIGIKSSLAFIDAFQLPGTFQGWTTDGSYSTTINYPAKCVVAYLGNGNVNYLE